MKSLNQERFLYSKTGVKVYLKPEYHPALKGTNLSHPDLVRKAKELFGDKHEKVKGLPKICSKPMYKPPPNLGYLEGNTEVDVTILAEKAIIFVEAKYHSEIDTRTTHCPNRDQIIRNIDIGTYYAWNKSLNFYFVLLTSSNCNKSRKLLKHYLENPQEIVHCLPHRTDIPKKIEQITDNMNLITWNQLHRI